MAQLLLWLGTGDLNGSNSGYTKVFQYDGSSWVQMGDTMIGDAATDKSYSLDSISADGTIIAIASKEATWVEQTQD